MCVRSRKRPKWQTAIWGCGLHLQREVDAEVVAAGAAMVHAAVELAGVSRFSEAAEGKCKARAMAAFFLALSGHPPPVWLGHV